MRRGTTPVLTPVLKPVLRPVGDPGGSKQNVAPDNALALGTELLFLGTPSPYANVLTLGS